MWRHGIGLRRIDNVYIHVICPVTVGFCFPLLITVILNKSQHFPSMISGHYFLTRAIMSAKTVDEIVNIVKDDGFGAAYGERYGTVFQLITLT